MSMTYLSQKVEQGMVSMTEKRMYLGVYLLTNRGLSSSRLLHSRQVVKGRKRLFIQSQGAEDRLHLRLEAVALDELPRLLPDLSIRSGRWYRPE